MNISSKIETQIVNKVGHFMSALITQHALPSFQNLKESQIFVKNGNDIVTEVDLTIEAKLTDCLLDLVPNSFALGEEAFAADPNMAEKAYAHDYVWIIDPLDGTRNFAKGVKCFSSLLALLYKGETIAAWLYDCMRDDVIVVFENQAYYLKVELEIERVKENTHIEISEISGQFSKIFQEMFIEKNGKTPMDSPDSQYNDLNITQRVELMKDIRSLRCAGSDFISLALGTRHLSAYKTLKPWDYVAGKFLLETIGGAFYSFQGNVIDPLQPSGPFVAIYNACELTRFKQILCLE